MDELYTSLCAGTSTTVKSDAGELILDLVRRFMYPEACFPKRRVVSELCYLDMFWECRYSIFKCRT